jgi:succinoglycan biosynthesis transport protein ExoP
MEETLDLRDVFAILRRKLRFIAVIFAVSMLAALLFLLIVKPKFTADATLIFNPGQFEISKEKSQLGPQLFDRLITGEIASVNSPAILSKAIKTENLLNDPELNKTSLKDMFGKMLSFFQLYQFSSSNHEMKVIERFKKLLVVDHPERTNLITISYTSEDPHKAARIANSVTNIFLANHLDNRLASTPLAAKWLRDRKVSLRGKWRSSQASVEKYKADHNLSYLSGKKLRDQQVDRLNEQIVLAETKTEAARARIEQVRAMLKTRDYQQLANTDRSEVLTKLRDRLAATSQREASLSTSLLPSHPTLQKVRAEIASVRKQINNEGKRVLDDLEVKFQAARAREKLIRQNFDGRIRSMQESGTENIKLRELERTAASDRGIYEAFLNRSNETIEQSTGSFANFRLIRVAQAPIKPSFPSKIKVLALTAIASLAIGIGLSFLLETLNNTFRSGAQVRVVLGLPLLASLPASDFSGVDMKRTPELAIIHQKGTRFLTGIKGIHRSISASGNNTGSTGIIAVTSAEEGEGKTVVAVALAQKAALAGARVLLIDGNWENPSLRQIFEHSSWNAGVNDDREAGGTDPLILTDQTTGLHILPAFSGAGGCKGIADTKEFQEMLGSARSQYDLVVVDTGAVQTNSDCWTLVEVADQVLFVIAWDKTRHDTAQRALQMLKNCDAEIAGAVLNFVEDDNIAQSQDYVPSAAPVGQHVLTGQGNASVRDVGIQQRPYPIG